MAFDAVIAALFADPMMTRPAVYAPQDGSGSFAIKVVVKQPDNIIGFGAGQIHAATSQFDVRVADVPQPVVGDQLTVNEVTYKVQSEPTADTERLVWTLNCVSL